MYLMSSWWGVSIQGLLGATSLILVTTLDDCIWLVPFVAINKRVATIHAVVFVTTLTLLAILLSLVSFIFIFIGTKRRIAAGEIEEDKEGEGDASSTTSVEMEDMELFLGIMGAGLCWILAAYLLYKRWMKRKRRRQAQQQDLEQQQQQQESSPLLVLAVNDNGTTTRTKTTTPQETAETMEEGDAARENNNDDGDSTSRPRLRLVISLTLLGFLDEMAYFPSLILTRVFTCTELCLGTFLAGLIMVGIVTLALAPCRPLIEWLDDHVKLYMVVTVFATVLSLQVLLEYLQQKER